VGVGNQDQEIALKSILLLHQWQVRGCTGPLHPGLTSKGCCIKNPTLKIKMYFGETPIFGKILFLENFS